MRRGEAQYREVEDGGEERSEFGVVLENRRELKSEADHFLQILQRPGREGFRLVQVVKFS
jgi:hypothetical protein